MNQNQHKPNVTPTAAPLAAESYNRQTSASNTHDSVLQHTGLYLQKGLV